VNALVGVLCRSCGRVPLPDATPDGVCSSSAECMGNRDGRARPVLAVAVEVPEPEEREAADYLRAESDKDYEHAMTCPFCIELYGQRPHGQRRRACTRWHERNK
jgi:hypothetical protein